MHPQKVVFQVFMVLLAMMCAWMLYSILFEYPYSTLLSFSAFSGQDIQENHVDTMKTQKLTNKAVGSYGAGKTKAALWQTADAMQIPFGSYYFYYTMLPNMRSDEGMNALLSKAVGLAPEKYQYKNLVSNDVLEMQGKGHTALQATVMLKNIPMNLSSDNDDSVLMNYPTDTDTKGRFYTTGWY